MDQVWWQGSEARCQSHRGKHVVFQAKSPDGDLRIDLFDDSEAADVKNLSLFFVAKSYRFLWIWHMCDVWIFPSFFEIYCSENFISLFLGRLAE